LIQSDFSASAYSLNLGMVKAQDAAAAAQQQALLIKQAQCIQMSNHIDQMQSSWWARNFDGNQINWEIKHHSPRTCNSVIGSCHGMGTMTLKEILNDLKEEITQAYWQSGRE
jgi:hypothetical protein